MEREQQGGWVYIMADRYRGTMYVSLHPYLDTAKYAAALKRLADTGFAEAGAAPIED